MVFIKFILLSIVISLLFFFQISAGVSAGGASTGSIASVGVEVGASDEAVQYSTRKMLFLSNSR